MKELITHRRTVHKYKPEKISEEVVKEVISLSLHVPNHRWTYPWKYVLVGDEARQKILSLAVSLKERDLGASLPSEALSTIKEKILNPSHLLILGRQKVSDEFQAKEDYATLSCSVQVMSLLFWQDGIGTKWGTSGLSRHPMVYKILGLDPDQVCIEGFFWIGVPEIIPPVRPRPELDQVLQTTK